MKAGPFAIDESNDSVIHPKAVERKFCAQWFLLQALRKVTIMTRRLFFLFLWLALAFSWFGISAAAATEDKPKEKDAAFDLKEVSIFDNGNMGQSLWRAVSVQCTTEPFKEVKAYPKLNSKHPLYGKLQFARTTPAQEEAPIYFVLDESGEQPAAVEKAAEEKKDQKSDAKKRAAAARPVTIKLSSYDRLYINANRDGDLTNNAVIKPMKNPPWNLIPGYGGYAARGILVASLNGRAVQRPQSEKERQAFELAAINVDYGPGVGVRPLKIFPWFILNNGEKAPTLRFAAATARKGTITIGKVEYEGANDAGRAHRPLRLPHDLGSTRDEESAQRIRGTHAAEA